MGLRGILRVVEYRVEIEVINPQRNIGDINAEGICIVIMRGYGITIYASVEGECVVVICGFWWINRYDIWV